jgi:hypothetical protein
VPDEKKEDLGALDRPADEQDFSREAHAGAEVADLGTSDKNSATSDTAHGAGSAHVWV